MSEHAQAAGSAELQADLWGERAGDWAEVMEGWNGWGIPLYRRVLEHVPVAEGSRVLDVGCGAGRFCRVAADRGARVSGIDATPALIEVARQRVLGGDFRTGEMEALPWPDDAFDLVTGFNSFFIAADTVNALREARRVARPGGRVAMTVFGRPERCDSTSVFASLAPLFAPPPGEEPAAEDSGDAEEADAPDEPEAPSLSEEGGLEALADAAGLAVEVADYLPFEERYPDLETVLRGMLAAPPFRRAARAAGEERVREVVAKALRAFEQADGSWRLREEARYLVAAVPSS